MQELGGSEAWQSSHQATFIRGSINKETLSYEIIPWRALIKIKKQEHQNTFYNSTTKVSSTYDLDKVKAKDHKLYILEWKKQLLRVNS